MHCLKCLRSKTLCCKDMKIMKPSKEDKPGLDSNIFVYKTGFCCFVLRTIKKPSAAQTF